MIKKYENRLLAFVLAEMTQDEAHDVNHILRVVTTAKRLCQIEDATAEVVIPAAYLHDCFTLPKNHPERSKSSIFAAEKATVFLRSIGYCNDYLDAIHHAIVAHSFSAKVIPQTLEAKIVQDADRLDALGAIGIARCLQVSNQLGVPLYSSDDAFCHQRTPDDRRYTIDHFYIKLFTLAETMNTESARAEAKNRTDFMKCYLDQLATEI